jgi:PAS domain S-box-containing protein
MLQLASQIEILIVEDDEDDYILIRSLLGDIGTNRYDMTWAATYEAALEAMERKDWGAILLDYRLGAHDGLDVLRAALARNCPSPVIMLTGVEAFAVDTAAMQSGASDYLVKSNLSAVMLERAIRYAIEHSRADQALRLSEARYRGIVEDQTELICRALPDTTLTFVNDAFCRYMGRTREELIGHRWLSDVLPEERPVVEQQLGGLNQGNHLVTGENRGRSAAGDMRWHQWTNRAICDEQGRVVELQSVGHDITERKLMEEHILSEVARGKLLLELYKSAPQLTDKELYDFAIEQAVHLTDSKIGFFLTVSDDEQGYLVETWSSETHVNCAVSDDRHEPIERAGIWADCIRLKRSLVYNDFPSSAGQKGLPQGHVPLQRLMTMPVIAGERTRFIFAAGNKTEPYGEQDTIQLHLLANELMRIIDQRRAEQELSASEALFHSLYQEAPIGVELYDEAGRLFDANPASLRIYHVDQLSDARGLVLFDDHNVSDQIRQRLQAGETCGYETSIDFEKLMASGLNSTRQCGVCHLNVLIKPLPGARQSKAGYMALVQDITERKLAEEELARHRDHLEELVRSRTESLEMEIAERELIADEMNKKTEALEALNRAMMTRENRVIELKEEINHLCKELGRPNAYPPLWVK